MKTAVSLPDDLFGAADALARDLGMSRSALYAAAVSEYVAKHRSRDLVETLDRVYGREDGGLDEALARAQAASVAYEPG